LAKFYVEHGDARQAVYWAERALSERPASLHGRLLEADALAAVGGASEKASASLHETLGLTPGPTAKRERVTARYISLGQRAARGGDEGQAARFFRRALLLDATAGPAHAGLARALLVRKEFPSALAAAQRAVQHAGEVADYHVLLGDALWGQGKTDEARAAWSRALELDPKSRGARRRLAREQRAAVAGGEPLH
jgi:tetratricopeptide (TPR) repeat protein